MSRKRRKSDRHAAAGGWEFRFFLVVKFNLPSTSQTVLLLYCERSSVLLVVFVIHFHGTAAAAAGLVSSCPLLANLCTLSAARGLPFRCPDHKTHAWIARKDTGEPL